MVDSVASFHPFFSLLLAKDPFSAATPFQIKNPKRKTCKLVGNEKLQ